MAKPTAANVTARFETDLATADIDRLIDAADFEIVSRFGAHASQVDELEGGGRLLWLSRPASSITAVVETIDLTDTTLAADDYEIRRNGWALKRLNTGTNQRLTWGTEAKVTYVPVADDRRISACIELVILAIQFQGLRSETVGDVSAVHAEYQRDKEAILRTLDTEQRMIA